MYFSKRKPSLHFFIREKKFRCYIRLTIHVCNYLICVPLVLISSQCEVQRELFHNKNKWITIINLLTRNTKFFKLLQIFWILFINRVVSNSRKENIEKPPPFPTVYRYSQLNSQTGIHANSPAFHQKSLARVVR